MPFSHYIYICYIYIIIINFVLTFCHRSATKFPGLFAVVRTKQLRWKMWELRMWQARLWQPDSWVNGLSHGCGSKSAWGPFVRLLDAGCQLPRQAAPTAFGCWCSESSPSSNEVCAAVECKLKLLGTKDWQTQKRRERCIFTVLFLLVGGVAALL